jgi:hypothetical protein
MATLILLPLFLCATNPDKIATNYFLPLNYKNYVEEQIILEMACVGNVQVSFTKEVSNKAQGEKWQTGAGLFLFWPAIFYLKVEMVLKLPNMLD